jgi:hypothetical protein
MLWPWLRAACCGCVLWLRAVAEAAGWAPDQPDAVGEVNVGMAAPVTEQRVLTTVDERTQAGRTRAAGVAIFAGLLYHLAQIVLFAGGGPSDVSKACVDCTRS